jgi:Ser/Thr protein kinase RdoA (MazF antagonist)
MALHRLDLAAWSVLEQYPAVLRAPSLLPLGNRGGFSGAQLWKVKGRAAPACLRAWPPEGIALERLAWIHRLMTISREAALHFVPLVFAASDGATWVKHAGRLWDLTEWMPGRADFHERPSGPRMQAACTSLARLHRAWGTEYSSTGSCPAVGRRLELLGDWRNLVGNGWQPTPAASPDPAWPWAERAWRLLGVHLGGVPASLALWAGRDWPLQPCLCDVWHDHVLFEGDAVTGLVDYGGVKVDHVAADLARLLGSTAGDDAGLRASGLEAYARVRPLSPDEEQLVRVLDETGTLLGIANWLRWLYHEVREFDDREGVARRLAALVERVEQWPV